MELEYYKRTDSLFMTKVQCVWMLSYAVTKLSGLPSSGLIWIYRPEAWPYHCPVCLSVCLSVCLCLSMSVYVCLDYLPAALFGSTGRRPGPITVLSLSLSVDFCLCLSVWIPFQRPFLDPQAVTHMPSTWSETYSFSDAVKRRNIFNPFCIKS
jgi:hypothetical protein